MSVENKIEFWKSSPVTSTESPIDVTEFLYSAPSEKRFRAEISANDFMFEQPITFQFTNWDNEFYDRLTYTETYDGISLITTNNAQGTTDYKYVSVSIKRSGLWIKKYAGKITRYAVESDELNGVVTIETESLMVRLKDVVMSEVADIYDGHGYPDTTDTISGKVKDIVTKIMTHCTDVDTVEFDTDTDYITATIYGAVEFDLDDLWFICQVWQQEAVDSTTCAEFLRTCCVVCNAVAFTDWRDGELVGFFRAKRRSGVAKEIPSVNLKGNFTIQPSFRDYDEGGKAIQSTRTRFDGSTVTLTHKRTERNPVYYESYVTATGAQKGDTGLTHFYVAPSVGDRFQYESHDTIYRRFSDGTIKPPLKQAVHEGEEWFLVTETTTSDLLFPECFFFKLPYPDVYVASDLGSHGVAKLYNRGSSLQTGYRCNSNHIADSWEDVRGVSVIPNIGSYGSDVELTEYKQVAGAPGIFSCNDPGLGSAGKLAHLSDVAPPDASQKIILNNNVGSTDVSGNHFEQCHAEFTKSTDDDGNIQTKVTLYAVCPEVPALYRFVLEYDTTLTEDNFDGGTNGKLNYYRLKAEDTTVDPKYGVGDDASVLAIGGCFINANVLNPYRDDRVYFTLDYGGDWHVYKMRTYGSNAVTDVYDMTGISANIDLAQIWISVDSGGQHIWFVGDNSTADQSTIYKDGLLQFVGQGTNPTPSLYGAVHNVLGQGCYIDDVHGICVSYDGYVFFSETTNKKVCVYDPHANYIYTIADSSVIGAPYQLACVDFVNCFDTGGITFYFRPQSDITTATAVSQGIFYSTPRRNASCEIIDPESDILPLDKLSFEDVAGASSDYEGLLFELSFDWTTHDYKFHQVVEA